MKINDKDENENFVRRKNSFSILDSYVQNSQMDHVTQLNIMQGLNLFWRFHPNLRTPIF